MKIVRLKDLEAVPASHESLDTPGVFKKIILHMDDLIDGRIQMINWALLPVGKSFSAHYHEDMQEVFILIKGKALMTIEQEQVEVQEGDTVVVPIGSVHTMENVGEKDVEYVVVGVSKGTRGRTVVI